MKQVILKNKLFYGGIVFLFFSLFLTINIVLHNKNYYDRNIIEISYIIVAFIGIVNFINSYLLIKNKFFISLSLGINRQTILKNI